MITTCATIRKEIELARFDDLRRLVDDLDVIAPLVCDDDAAAQPACLCRIAHQERQLESRQIGKRPSQAERVGARSDLFPGKVPDIERRPQLSGRFNPYGVRDQTSVQGVAKSFDRRGAQPVAPPDKSAIFETTEGADGSGARRRRGVPRTRDWLAGL